MCIYIYTYTHTYTYIFVHTHTHAHTHTYTPFFGCWKPALSMTSCRFSVPPGSGAGTETSRAARAAKDLGVRVMKCNESPVNIYDSYWSGSDNLRCSSKIKSQDCQGCMMCTSEYPLPPHDILIGVLKHVQIWLGPLLHGTSQFEWVCQESQGREGKPTQVPALDPGPGIWGFPKMGYDGWYLCTVMSWNISSINGWWLGVPPFLLETTAVGAGGQKEKLNSYGSKLLGFWHRKQKDDKTFLDGQTWYHGKHGGHGGHGGHLLPENKRWSPVDCPSAPRPGPGRRKNAVWSSKKNGERSWKRRWAKLQREIWFILRAFTSPWVPKGSMIFISIFLQFL